MNEPDLEQEIIEACRAFDQGGTGLITLAEFRFVMTQL
jgi:Ca2+-binding EF-hand superfamily protein